MRGNVKRSAERKTRKSSSSARVRFIEAIYLDPRNISRTWRKREGKRTNEEERERERNRVQSLVSAGRTETTLARDRREEERGGGNDAEGGKGRSGRARGGRGTEIEESSLRAVAEAASTECRDRGTKRDGERDSWCGYDGIGATVRMVVRLGDGRLDARAAR